VKIVHLETGRHLYGGARQVGYLINALADRGVENLLVCCEGHALAEDASARVFEWRLGGDLDFWLKPRLTRLLCEQRPDVLHVHSRRGADTFGGRAARSADIPAVLTRRVQSAEPGIWLRFKCRPYRAIVAISRAVGDELIARGVADGRQHLIPSAVDTALFRPDPGARSRLIERYALPADALLAGSAAQFTRRKGQDLLLRVVARLTSKSPGDDVTDWTSFRLLLFGQGPERIRLERTARDLDIEKQLVFCGFEPDWPVLLPGLDLFLHPARREGLGAAVLEAMSAGVPVVASKVGGIVDVIDDGVDGRLVAASALDDWVRAVHRLLVDSNERARLGTAGRRTVESRFTIDRMTDSYLALYRDVLGRDN
jgi:glycosyltransferase involved in cell wall biosynthesis